MHNFSLTKPIILFIILLVTNKLFPQVTIGNSEPPIQGVLLQLQNIDNITNDNANSTKGLALPRVNLTDVRNLYPMFLNPDKSVNVDYSTPNQKENEDTKHTGLIVYNTNRCLPTHGDGLYVWDGNIWNKISMKKTLILNDDRGSGHVENYIVGDFEDAGIWMLENLRAFKYADRTNPVIDPIVIELPDTPHLGTFPHTTGEVSWAYPAPINNSNPLDNSYYVSDPKIGLLYTMSAANNSKAPNPDVNEGGMNIGYTQGICPIGWHLPSDKEWLDLENKISLDTKKYANVSNIKSIIVDQNVTVAGPAGWQDDRANGVGLAMKGFCKTPNTSNTPMGESHLSENGGFNALMVGMARATSSNQVGVNREYGATAYFWTSSCAGVLPGFDEGGSPVSILSYYIRLLGRGKQNSMRRVTSPQYRLSVRCKKDNYDTTDLSQISNY